MRPALCLLPPLALAITALAQLSNKTTSSWEEVQAKGKPHKRHEHAFVKVAEKFYTLGGRRVQPVDIFDPATQTWSTGKAPPVELHHFQALEHEGRVLVAGAFTGRYPAETPVADFYFYDPKSDAWSTGPQIPEDRRRGSSGAFLRDGKLYLVCGLTDGHRSGWVTWFDEYNFETGTWRKLPDAPHARDHFQASLVGDKLVLAGGRRSGEGGSTFKSVIREVDVYDFKSNKWTTLKEPLPTPRAGTMSLTIDGEALVIGGESARKEAHVEVEALNLKKGTWRSLPSLSIGRHATQPVLHDGAIYLHAGSATRGGTETSSLIRLPLKR